MIRRLLIAVVVTFLTVGTLIGSPLPATAATQDYSSAQAEQSYTGQAEYDKKQESTDYSYTDKQTNQAKPQEKQSNQSDDKQYAQQEQSYQKKQ